MSEPVDYTTPTLFSEEQLKARAEAIAAALTARGLTARVLDGSHGDVSLRVENPVNCHSAKVYLDDEGGAEWEAHGDTSEGASAEDIVAGVAGVVA